MKWKAFPTSTNEYEVFLRTGFAFFRILFVACTEYEKTEKIIDSVPFRTFYYYSTSACPAMFSNFLEIQTMINFANTASTQILFLFTIFYQYRSKIGEHALQTFAIRVWNHRFARFGKMRHYVKCFSSLYGFHCSSISRHSKHYFPQFPLMIEVTNSFGVLRCIYQQ